MPAGNGLAACVCSLVIRRFTMLSTPNAVHAPCVIVSDALLPHPRPPPAARLLLLMRTFWSGDMRGLSVGDGIFWHADSEMAGRHRCRPRSIQIIRTGIVEAKDTKRPDIQQFHVSYCWFCSVFFFISSRFDGGVLRVVAVGWYSTVYVCMPFASCAAPFKSREFWPGQH